FDLPLGEGLDPLPPECNRTDRVAFPQQRYAKSGAQLPQGGRLGAVELRIGCHVFDMDDPAVQRCSPHDDTPMQANSGLSGADASEVRFILGRKSEVCDQSVQIAFAAVDKRHLCVAQPGDGFDERVEDWM